MGCGFMFGEVVNYLRINQMKMLGLGRLFDTVRGGGGDGLFKMIIFK